MPLTYAYATFSGTTNEEKIALHEEWAPKMLHIILEMGGYYIKGSQMACGMNLLPKPYEKHFEMMDTYENQMRYFVDVINSKKQTVNDFDYAVKILKLANDE